MKKACITVREQMINEMGEKGELPVSLLPKLSQKGSGILPASAPSRPAAQDFRCAADDSPPASDVWILKSDVMG